jgi:hypothetical protein
LVTNLPLAAVVEAVGDEGVLVDALGLDGAGVEAAGGGGVGVDGEDAGGEDVCASALVNAKALTAAAAMTCFNISASWGDLCERFPVASVKPASCSATRE